MERKEVETSLIIDLFRALMIAQPFLFIWIIEDDTWEFLNKGEYEYFFHNFSMIFILLVGASGFKIGFYSNELLILYALMVWVSVMSLIKEHNFSFRKAIANGFLIVYLNSWFWESFLHIWAILENGLNLNQLFQALHLIPAIYFLMRYKFDVSEAINQLWNGFFISTIISYLRVYRIWKYLPIVHTEFTVYLFNHGLMILNRLICWVFLFNAIIIWGMHKEDYRKLIGQSKVLNT